MILTTLLEPFQFSFMVNALVISTIVAVPCALLSVFLVLKGWALMGDAMSHAVFPGIVLAYIAGIPLAIGAFVAGLVLYVSIQSEVHLDHILFGDMLGISLTDIMQTMAIALGIALIIGLKWKDLLLHAFDPHQAKASGLNTPLLHYGLLCMIALTIVATLKSVGIILSISLLIAPGAIAILMTRKFSHALWLAVVMSVITSFMGVYLSFFIDSAPAPTIVVLFSLLFVITFIYATLRDRRLENQLQVHDV
ncbi:MAG: metal ABC transporter permease [Citrobacter freundii]|nr:metal ABC transporter permease [Citrobacter freundii]